MFTLRLMPWQLSILKLSSGEPYEWAKNSCFYSLSQTPDELSLVVETELVPEHLTQEKGWKILKIEAILDFDLVGTMAKISGILADANVSIFAISTYNTDYIMVKEEQVAQAINSLKQNDYKIIEREQEMPL